MKLLVGTQQQCLSEEAFVWLANYKNWKVNKIMSMDKYKDIEKGFFTFFDNYYLIEEYSNEEDIAQGIQTIGPRAIGPYKKFTVIEIEDDDLFDPDVPIKEEEMDEEEI
jgi:hypothetical protein